MRVGDATLELSGGRPTIAKPWREPQDIEREARLFRAGPAPGYDLAEAVPAGFPMSATYGAYPDTRGISSLREAIAARENTKYGLRLTADNIVVTFGATEAIFLICDAFLAPGECVEAHAPALTLYRDIIENRGAAIAPIGRAGRPPLLRIVHNPSNPAGQLQGEDALADLMAVSEADGAMLVLDQVYDELIFDGRRPRESQAMIDRGNVIKVNSISKSFAAPGLRLGWIVCHPDIATQLSGLAERQRISVAIHSQMLGADLLRGPLDQLVPILAERRNLVAEALMDMPRLGGRAPRGGVFYWLELEGAGAAAFADRARSAGTWVLPGGIFWGGDDHHLRLSFGSVPETLCGGLRVLRECLAVPEVRRASA